MLFPFHESLDSKIYQLLCQNILCSKAKQFTNQDSPMAKKTQIAVSSSGYDYKFSTLPSSLTHSSLNPTISSLSLYIYTHIVKTISTQLGAGSEGPRIGSRPIQTFARHSLMTIIMSRTISFHLLWLFEL